MRRSRRPSLCEALATFAFALTLAIGASVRAEVGPDMADAPAAETESTQEWTEPVIVEVSTGFTYLTGDYGEEKSTDIYAVPVSVEVERFPFVAEFTVPILRIRGPANVVVADGRGTNTDPLCLADPFLAECIDRETEVGVGDVALRATYLFWKPEWHLPLIELTGRVKFPSGDRDDGLGIGKVSYTAQLDVSRAFGPFAVFGTFGRRFFHSSKRLDLDDAFFTSVGFGMRTTLWLSTGLSYDWWQTTASSIGDAHELSPYASLRIGKHLRIGPYGIVGLSEDATNWGLGCQIGITKAFFGGH